MSKRLQSLAVLVALASLLAARAEAGCCYTSDPRAEASGIPAWAGYARADCLIVNESNVTPDPLKHGYSRLAVVPWTLFDADPDYPACSTRDYHNQPSASGGSGVLVNANQVLTAGHLVNPDYPQFWCGNQKIIFDFGSFPGEPAIQMTCNLGECWVLIPNSKIYDCQSVVDLRDTTPPVDLAVLTLTQSPSGRSPRPINTTGSPDLGSDILVIGHPNRIPLKLENSTVSYSGPWSIQTGHHVRGGNSGSMALNPFTGVVDGIVVSGPTPLDLDCFTPFCYRECLSAPGSAILAPAYLAAPWVN